MPETRNSKLLAEFVAYCEAHPTETFWQALANWSGYPFIYASWPRPRPDEIRRNSALVIPAIAQWASNPDD